MNLLFRRALSSMLTIVILAPLCRTAVGDESSKPLTAGAIDERTVWKTSRVVGSPDPPTPYRIKRAFPELSLEQPIFLEREPGTDGYLVVQHLGFWSGPSKLLRFANKPGVDEAEPLLDIDQLVYGLTFHPNYAENGYVYLFGNGRADAKPKEGARPTMRNRIARYTVRRTTPFDIDPASEHVVIEWKSGGHNGGGLGFGPDGMLYLSSGDGSSSSDSDNTGQNLTDLNATVLRIDVDHPDDDRAYSVPPDNPFLEYPDARPEIWAYGFRNPWRLAFDRETGHLWVGANGQDLWETVHFVRRGDNHGWSIYEGSHMFRPQRERGPTPIVKPAAEHHHSEARSLTGGVVYYGSKLPELQGAYIYGDYSTGTIWGIRHDGKEVTWNKELARTRTQMTHFAEGIDGELLVVDHAGRFYELEPTPKAAVTAKFPTRLGETGLFTSVERHETDPALIPYTVIAPQWVDGASQERFLGIPGTGQIKRGGADPRRRRGRNAWDHPEGTVIIKTLSLELEPGNPASRRRIETQLLTLQGEWAGYTYRWNDEQTEATLTPAGGDSRVLTIRDAKAPGGQRRQEWRFAGRAECSACHSRAADYVLGFTNRQLDLTCADSPSDENQIKALVRLDVLENAEKAALRSKALRAKASKKNVSRKKASKRKASKKDLERRRRFRRRFASVSRKLVNPFDETESVDARARSYVQTNCACCHVREGGGNARIDLSLNASDERSNLFDALPQHDTFGMAGARVIARGDPYRSVLYYRMSTLGGGRMPRAGASLPDEKGLELIHRWISEMPQAKGAGDDDAFTQSLAVSNAALDTLASTSASSAKRVEAIDLLVATAGRALFLLREIEEGRLPDEAVEQVVAKANTLDVGPVRDLLERLIPYDQRVKRLGTVVRAKEILALRGDSARGKELFFNGAGVQCKSCHRIGEVGTPLGPDLTTIGQKNKRDQLIESILEPSKKIDAKYVSYAIETVDGDVLTGLLIEKTPAEVVLKDAKNKEIRVPADDVEIMIGQPRSLMPDLLVRDLTAQQFADLLEYLTNLK